MIRITQKSNDIGVKKENADFSSLSFVFTNNSRSMQFSMLIRQIDNKAGRHHASYKITH